MITAVPAENLFRFCAHGLAVVHDVEMRLDFSKEHQRFPVGSPITKQRQRFTDDIPGDIKPRTGPSRIRRKILGLLVVDIAWVEAGVKKDVSQNRLAGSVISGSSERNHRDVP